MSTSPTSTFNVLKTLDDGGTVIECHVPWHQTEEGAWRATCMLHDGLVIGLAPIGDVPREPASHIVTTTADPEGRTWADGCLRVSPVACHGNPGFCTRCSPRSHGQYGEPPRPEAHEPAAKPPTPYQRAVEVFGSEGALRQSVDACRRCDMEPGTLWVARSCPDHGSLAEGMVPDDAVRIKTPPETETERAVRLCASRPCPACCYPAVLVISSGNPHDSPMGVVCTDCGATFPIPDEDGWPEDYVTAVRKAHLAKIQSGNLEAVQREMTESIIPDHRFVGDLMTGKCATCQRPSRSHPREPIPRDQQITVDGDVVTVPRAIAEAYRDSLLTNEQVLAAMKAMPMPTITDHGYQESADGSCIACTHPKADHLSSAADAVGSLDTRLTDTRTPRPPGLPRGGILTLHPYQGESEKGYGAVSAPLVWSVLAVVLALASLVMSLLALS